MILHGIPIYNFISDSKVGRPNASPYPFFAYMPIYFSLTYEEISEKMLKMKVIQNFVVINFYIIHFIDKVC